MEDLYSIANSSFYSSSSLGWEYQNLGVFNADMSHSFGMGSINSLPYSSALDNLSDYSTGYLQDALLEFSSKRRRLLLFSEEPTNYSACPVESCWKENLSQIYPGDFGDLNQTNEMDKVKDKMKNENNRDVEASPEEARPAFEGNNNLCSSSSSPNSKDSVQTGSISQSLDSLAAYSPLLVDYLKKRKEVIMTRVVYPFAVVKPGGKEGEITLNDINERISMTPTRPVRHPVGDFACRPVASPHGHGLSGKAVVALTKIQTQGRGTITIIRTRG
ncbi:hypothetical protein DCAR_0935207 [Daucus carota subsp. sativus]|uniref:Protein XRI1 n=1 Tax=Daucus carota subsp. sativus TaxID=79200 RepID=A0AAF1BDE7_DAUCS|nr:hypothetical protein DCAR_0935207 [Daucus carota subsp. sativus]